MGNLLVARYETNAAQNIPDASIEIIDYEDVVFDPYGHVTWPGGDWTFTAIHEGYYYCTAAVLFAASSGWVIDEFAILYIYKNGADHSRVDWNDHMEGASINAHLRGSDLVDLDAGETMNFRVYQGSGAAINLNSDPVWNHCSIFKV